MTLKGTSGLLLAFPFSESTRIGLVTGDGLFARGEDACGEGKLSRPLLAALLMRGSVRGVAGKADRSRGVSSMPCVVARCEDGILQLDLDSNFLMFAFGTRPTIRLSLGIGDVIFCVDKAVTMAFVLSTTHLRNFVPFFVQLARGELRNAPALLTFLQNLCTLSCTLLSQCVFPGARLYWFA